MTRAEIAAGTAIPRNGTVAALRAEGLALVRGGRLLFEGLSFTLAPGEAMLVTGRNGSGKSSLLRLVAGLLAADGGVLENPFATTLLASEQALKSDQPVEAELAFWAGLDGVAPELLHDAAERMVVTALFGFRCGQLSSGQRQRVAITRAIASGATLWLLDEPTNALDRASEQRLLAAIAAHRASGGLVMAATHQPLPLAGAKRLEL